MTTEEPVKPTYIDPRLIWELAQRDTLIARTFDLYRQGAFSSYEQFLLACINYLHQQKTVLAHELMEAKQRESANKVYKASDLLKELKGGEEL